MTPTTEASVPPLALPDHKQLPCEDGRIVENYQEHPQSNILTDSLRPRLNEVYGIDRYSIGQDSGIYWRLTEPPLDGCKAPDWFLVPHVHPMLDGELRRSYVLWKEFERPLLVAEYVSGDGQEERDRTPHQGKFWVYERALAVPYYVIFDPFRQLLEVYHLEDGHYRQMAPNAHGRYLIAPLRIELGIWQGRYRDLVTAWLRPWDADTGKLLPLSEERAEQAESIIDHLQELAAEATERADTERRRAEEALERLRQLEEKLRSAGIDPVS